MYHNSMNHKDVSLLIDTAMLAAVMILENGGETFRAEETASRICACLGEDAAEVVAFPTCIIISANSDDGKVSSVIRIKERSINLFRVERVNYYSRAFSEKKITLDELREKLRALKNSKITSNFLISIFAAISSAMFTLLFESRIDFVALFDSTVAFICAFIMQYVLMSTRLKRSYGFTRTFVGSGLIAVIAVACTSLFGIGNLDCIIIGAITPILPGISLTNAIRDTVTGDIISGTARIVDTLLIAVAIAGGVGVVLAAYVSLMGGVI